LIPILCIAALAACNKTVPATPDQPATGAETFSVRILPVMTKVTDTAFENGDAIGVTITRESGAHATNEKLTYNGTEFSGSLMWYAEGTAGATVSAYYP
jgi:hypothetical protein